MSSELVGVNILIFSQFFFNYENKIAEKYREMGAHIDLYNERSISSDVERALLKICPRIFKSKTDKYYFTILNSCKNKTYTHILFVDCEMLTEKVLIMCKKTFPRAKLCLYMWDSLKNLHCKEKILKHFDYISSFDRKDSIKNTKINFRPLFFCDEYRCCKNKNENEFKYDICFVGTLHTDRYKICKSLMVQMNSKRIKWFFYPYLQNRYVYYFYRFFKKEYHDTLISDFNFRPISAESVAKIIDNSRAVLDIQHHNQSGLTMRTLETLGMKKKLITTNEEVRNYDFYNPSNIAIIDRKSQLFLKILFFLILEVSMTIFMKSIHFRDGVQMFWG